MPASVLPARPIAVPRPEGKVAGAVRQAGRMFAMAFEALRQAGVHGVPVSELVDQCWFLARVTTLPLVLVSIPFGMVIALEVGSLLEQIGAQSQLGAAMHRIEGLRARQQATGRPPEPDSSKDELSGGDVLRTLAAQLKEERSRRVEQVSELEAKLAAAHGEILRLRRTVAAGPRD